MALNEKEKTTIKDLQTQEQTCIKKYKKYGQDAKDPVLKELFSTLEKNEQKHYDTLGQILEEKFLNVTATTVREKSMSLRQLMM